MNIVPAQNLSCFNRFSRHRTVIKREEYSLSRTVDVRYKKAQLHILHRKEQKEEVEGYESSDKIPFPGCLNEGESKHTKQ